MSDNHPTEAQNQVVSRIVSVDGQPVAVRMEAIFWDALGEICRREHQDPGLLVTRIDASRGGVKLSAILRVFTVLYFRTFMNQDGDADLLARPGFAEDPPGPSPQFQRALDALGPPRRGRERGQD